MGRKFRPDQCPKCRWGRFLDEQSIKDGASPYCEESDDYPVDLIGETYRLCFAFSPKPKEVSNG